MRDKRLRNSGNVKGTKVGKTFEKLVAIGLCANNHSVQLGATMQLQTSMPRERRESFSVAEFHGWASYISVK